MVDEFGTLIAHLGDVVGDQTHESLARKRETMTTAEMMTYAYDQTDQARTASRNGLPADHPAASLKCSIIVSCNTIRHFSCPVPKPPRTEPREKIASQSETGVLLNHFVGEMTQNLGRTAEPCTR
jgi:hypothetical protein